MMPLIKLKHVVSFTSEDPGQTASNLLKPETYRKWRCANKGEKQASVILELEKSTKIHSVDIGNNGSAFVEVLVGRGSWDSTEQFKVLLVTSSFMSPAESKSFTNASRVRMFGNEKLSKPVADERWDRVKLVCTQPFNKGEQYGLSFVSLHSPPDESDTEKQQASATSVATPKRLGNFTLRDDEEDSFTPGSMFFKKKKTPPPLSAAAEVRAASSVATSTFSEWSASGGNSRNRQPIAKPKEEKDGSEKPATVKPVPVKLSKPFTPSKKIEVTNKRKHEDSPKTDKTRKDEITRPSKKISPPPKRQNPEESAKAKEKVPLNKIMRGVVFVLSGFKNPERGELRDKALQMGAQYKADWTNECTHLVFPSVQTVIFLDPGSRPHPCTTRGGYKPSTLCGPPKLTHMSLAFSCAFPNTPKYSQVKGKGKIVSKKWITDSYRKEAKLPTRRYHLSGDTSSSDESTEDEVEEVRRPPPLPKPPKDDTPPPEKQDVTESSSRRSPVQSGRDVEMVAIEEQKKAEERKTRSHLATQDSEDEDTEDELERVQQNSSSPAHRNEDIYEASTDEESDKGGQDSDTPDELPELPDFFSHKIFLLYGEFEEEIRRSLVRYITAYNGVLEEYMSDNVDYVITNERWDQNFDDALAENASLAFVRPKWIFACDEKCSLVPFQPYIIVPE